MRDQLEAGRSSRNDYSSTTDAPTEDPATTEPRFAISAVIRHQISLSRHSVRLGDRGHQHSVGSDWSGLNRAASKQQDSYCCGPEESGYAWGPKVPRADGRRAWVLRGGKGTPRCADGAGAKHAVRIDTQPDVGGDHQRDHDRNHD